MQAPLSTAQRHHEPARRAGIRSEDDPRACTAQLRIAGPPAAVAAAIRSADPATRGQLIGQLQGQVGNATVSRLLAPDHEAEVARADMPVQRWAVTLPRATADCMVVVDWLNRHSPYSGRSGWALTSPTFGWGGDYSYSGSGEALTVSMVRPTVSLSTTVDMPSWAPTDPVMKQAWASMSTELRAHEARHEEVATNWKATLLDRLKGLSLSIRTEGDGPAAVRKEWASWLVEHQADQSALDPFSATLDRSGGGNHLPMAVRPTHRRAPRHWRCRRGLIGRNQRRKICSAAVGVAWRAKWRLSATRNDQEGLRSRGAAARGAEGGPEGPAVRACRGAGSGPEPWSTRRRRRSPGPSRPSARRSRRA